MKRGQDLMLFLAFGWGDLTKEFYAEQTKAVLVDVTE
jgi:hypothetical protein